MHCIHLGTTQRPSPSRGSRTDLLQLTCSFVVDNFAVLTHICMPLRCNYAFLS